MVAQIFRITQTGVSTTAGYSTVYFPDIYKTNFNVSIGTVVTSTAMTYSVQHSYDFPGENSSTWASTAATWFTNTSFSSIAGVNAFGSYTNPVTAIRLNVTTGTTAASTASVAMTIVQGG